MKLIKIIPSTKTSKKYDAVFETAPGRNKTISFGAKGMSDYTINKDPIRRERYLARHRAREDWNKPDTAGALSRWLLWGDSTSMSQNIADFKKRFNL